MLAAPVGAASGMRTVGLELCHRRVGAMNLPLFQITKPKIAKGRSYILKTSLLQEAVSAAGIAIPIMLDYWTPQHDGSVLQAFFWPPSPECSHSR
jgi:hypothetical protein